MLILPTQGKDFLRRCCTYFGIGGALILELTLVAKGLFTETNRREQESFLTSTLDSG